ncbi:MAG: thioredoxin [Thermofilaceae archaeon]|nr:thioredoxin [Thermofilaceae archaeon]MCX8181160.1 thioredoxin [Thermofilaceae archaeon]MDW8004783.1 thioredoxin [Thermofilaceae archaeon]
MSDSDEDAIISKTMAEIMKKRKSQESSPCPQDVVYADRDLLEHLVKECRVVVADFWAEWCGPCKMVAPLIEDVARKYSPRIAVAKVNVDENSDLALEYGIMSIPTIIVFDRGNEFRRFVGYYPGLARELFKTIESLL